MLTRRRFLSLSARCVAGSLSGGLFLPDARGASKTQLAVLVSEDSSLASISLYELKRLYLGDKIRISGHLLIPLNRGPRTPERVGFDRAVLEMSPEQVARYWIDRRIRGQSGAPKAVDPATILRRIIARLPGAIGYSITHAGQSFEGLKALEVDGKKPGDAGYSVVY